jgi:hypothetical protein
MIAEKRRKAREKNAKNSSKMHRELQGKMTTCINK